MSSQMESLSQGPSKSGAVVLTGKNIDVTIAMNELVFIYFYQTQYQSRYNISFSKEFDEVADYVRKAFPRKKKIVMGKVDSHKEKAVLSRFGFWYDYTGMIAYRNGEQTKLPSLYTPLKDYIFSELQDPIRQFRNSKELENLDTTKHLIVGYFDKEDMPEYDNLRRVAHNLKEYCQFYVRYGYSFDNETSTHMRPPNQPTIVFRPGNARSKDKRDTFKGCVKKYDDLNLWAHKKCIVREMTFDNFEELHKECQSFLILFYNPSNCTVVNDFCDVIGRTLMGQKHRLNIVTADGMKFASYLHEYGKKKKDLPIIMKENGIFPDYKDIFTPGKLRTFAMKYHYGPCRVSIEKHVKSMKKRTKSTSPKR